MTITIKQYASQEAAQNYCKRADTLLPSVCKSTAWLVVNQVDEKVFQVELIFDGRLNEEVNLLPLLEV